MQAVPKLIEKITQKIYDHNIYYEPFSIKKINLIIIIFPIY